jgi:hypothetical protein
MCDGVLPYLPKWKTVWSAKLKNMTDISEILPKAVGTMNLPEVQEKNYFLMKRCYSEDDQVGSCENGETE